MKSHCLLNLTRVLSFIHDHTFRRPLYFRFRAIYVSYLNTWPDSLVLMLRSWQYRWTIGVTVLMTRKAIWKFSRCSPATDWALKTPWCCYWLKRWKIRKKLKTQWSVLERKAFTSCRWSRKKQRGSDEFFRKTSYAPKWCVAHWCGGNSPHPGGSSVNSLQKSRLQRREEKK